MKRFDRKFGVDFLKALPKQPAVYLFKDANGGVIYAGKAKDIRQRLIGYRNATRRKAHRKMRTLVREAASLEVLLQDSETAALLLENQLIRELRPEYNVDGAFDFLYPAIGTSFHERRLLLCFTTQPDRFDTLEMQWHGVFRPRLRAQEAFHALVELFSRVGHIEPRSRLPEAPNIKGSRLVAIRRVPTAFLDTTRRYFDGEDDALLPALFTQLLESDEARRSATDTQGLLKTLQAFFHEDTSRLRAARLMMGRPHAFVPQNERDSLFIQSRAAEAGLVPDQSQASDVPEAR
ncbi:MAG: GIY-YIG nuclease family protein [bacterium]